MGVLSSLVCHFILLGLSSAQLDRKPLVRSVRDWDPKFADALPAPQKYNLTTWAEDDIDRGLPADNDWIASYYDEKSPSYCREDLSIYNVTFSDCPEPWLVGHCARSGKTREETIGLLASLPSSARGVISDVLYSRTESNQRVRIANKNSVQLAGSFQPADGLRMVLKALWSKGSGPSLQAVKDAIAADTCVADEAAATEVKRDTYAKAVDAGLTVAAYLKFVNDPPLNASCMSNQLKLFQGMLDKRWDAPGQCPNKIAPKLEKHKTILFTRGLGELNSDPVPNAGPAIVVRWRKSDGYPEYCWNQALTKRSPTDSRVRCQPDRLTVYNVTYSDCTEDPWVLCRCSDAQESMPMMVTRFGKIPARLRSHVRHLVAFNHPSSAGLTYPSLNMITILGSSSDSVYFHEASHCRDQGFHKSREFQRAKEQDTCWPSKYSKTTDAELFAEMGVAHLYNSSGKTLLERGYDPACLSNGLGALKKHVGDDYSRSSKCFKRQPNSRIIHPSAAQFLNSEPHTSGVEDISVSRPSIWDQPGEIFEDPGEALDGGRQADDA
ncbi:hypothetical protein AJ78_07764 [Emergomyces pasteurianus Ep9510]|uniref:Lysine-specific metallo-endopeptidase domain-containing protein n=1 Tax=Emergomyces pasteurianus Ep9510 TaxID=1447872 RepID=A0A1J9Q6C0_9EURO|nr:hypothetical protein AJ78_07764 [Emergomyces pasteurianus Ep9510]